MKVTPNVKTAIIRAMSRLKLNQSQLAGKMGVHRSYISKLLKEDGEIMTLSEKMIDEFNDALEITLNPVTYQEGSISPAALDFPRKSPRPAAAASAATLAERTLPRTPDRYSSRSFAADF